MITKEQIKKTGATFTPKGLSDFLAARIVSYTNGKYQDILDPACGDGELLISIGNRLSQDDLKFSLTGYDSNVTYLNFAQERARTLNINSMEFVHGDFLQAIDVTSCQNTLNLYPDEKKNINSCFDIVIANPPYVRTQILGADNAQELSKKFNLKGRIDLYYPFLIAMTESLKEGGILGVITSNRYLSTKSGEGVRKFLSENYEILELIDLGDTKLFDAAVLPAIFIGRKVQKKKRELARFTSVYQELNGYQGDLISAKTIYEVLLSPQAGYFLTDGKKYKKTSGLLKYKIASGSVWEMFSNNEAKWVEKIDNKAKFRIKDLFKVKVGIKSTADKVFISDKWDDLKIDKPEDELLRDLISQENIQRWNAKHNYKLKVLYPHISVNGEKQTVEIEKYPKAFNYFVKHEKVLKSRKYLIDSGRKWFELWVSHRPDQWKYPKLVFPDISSNPRFYFDEDEKIVNGNCYWIMAARKEDVEKLLFIQGLANSNLMTKYHDLVFKNKLYSGKRRYISQYVENYPIPDYNTPVANEIISIVRKLNQSDFDSENLKLEMMLETKIAEAFGVDPIFSLD